MIAVADWWPMGQEQNTDIMIPKQYEYRSSPDKV